MQGVAAMEAQGAVSGLKEAAVVVVDAASHVGATAQRSPQGARMVGIVVAMDHLVLWDMEEQLSRATVLAPVVAGTMEEAERADVVAVEAVDRVTLRDLRYLTTLQAKQGTALSRLLLRPAARVMCSPVAHA